MVVLGDELYLGSNHGELARLAARPFDAICRIQRSADLDEIKRNYSVRLEDGQISALVEKPTRIENHILGCGTFVFNTRSST